MADNEANMPPAADKTAVDDPLVAGLPPTMDYITYLTLLEYQLTPQNLPTLNRLLREDDGTLASEIGWDLLKLVLPILRVEQQAAQDCLDIIARRGNPREVIVRVSEELERLGQHDHDDEDDQADDQPTFAGEAPPVHLGQMTLDGKSQPLQGTSQPEHQRVQVQEQPDTGGTNDELTFVALVSMLPSLHSRIKTKHPSRFLATSLPAALSAFRRIPASELTAPAFLNTLTSLAGTKRPPLPPRISTLEILKSASAPLPDPESKSETTNDTDTAKVEGQINQRLLQAVLLEIFEERTVVSMEAHPPLTAQARYQLEHESLLLPRRQDLEALRIDLDVQAFDESQDAFFNAAKTLKLDLLAEITNLQAPTDDEVGEYPTSPSHIPLSTLGLLLLYSADLLAPVLDNKAADGAPLPVLEALQTILSDKQSEDYLKIQQSMPALDNILSLLYLTFWIPPTSTFPQPLLLDITYFLLDVCTHCADADLRDNAYHIATHLVHGHLNRESRLAVLRGLIAPAQTHAEPLRSVAVNWLKDELFPTPASQAMISKWSLHPEEDRGLPVSCLKDFPELFAMRDENALDGQNLQAFMEAVPFYNSVMNLLTVLGRHVGHGTAEADVDVVLAKGASMLSKLETQNAALMSHVAASSSETDEPEIPMADVFALEDALIRAREVFPADE